MTKTVNLQSIMDQCLLTRNVKLPTVTGKLTKNCQESINMQPVKPKMDMWSKKPAKLPSSYKKKDQDDFKSQYAMCSDKKCQEIPNVQKRPKKPISHL